MLLNHNMRLSYLLFSTVILFIVTSCNKEARPTNEVPENNDSVYLSKMLIDYYGDTTSYNYLYDNQKRLIKINISDNGENESNNFLYNGSDTLPYKYLLTVTSRTVLFLFQNSLCFDLIQTEKKLQ